MIQPTVGKRLWYWPTLATKAYAPYDLSNQPLAATITHVNADGTVNISYLNRNGELEARRTVYLWQRGTMRPGGSFCEYHPDDTAFERTMEESRISLVSSVIKSEELPSTDNVSRPVLSLKKAPEAK
jgi:hypothetical protein